MDKSARLYSLSNVITQICSAVQNLKSRLRLASNNDCRCWGSLCPKSHRLANRLRKVRRTLLLLIVCISVIAGEFYCCVLQENSYAHRWEGTDSPASWACRGLDAPSVLHRGIVPVGNVASYTGYRFIRRHVVPFIK